MTDGPAEPPEAAVPAPAPGGRSSPPAGGPPYVEEALSADAEVVEERGRWIVYLNVLLASGAVRRKVGDYPDQRRAEHAGRIIERNARRHIRPAVFAEEATWRRPPGDDEEDVDP